MIKHLLTAHMFPYPQFIISTEQLVEYGHTHTPANNARSVSGMKRNGGSDE